MMYYLNVGIYNSLLMSFLDQTYFDLPEPLKVKQHFSKQNYILVKRIFFSS